MSNYKSVEEINKRIISDGIALITYDVEENGPVIHSFSLPGYEYLSGEFVEFLDKFRTIIPKKVPIVLEITSESYNGIDKKTIDDAVWMHYGLYLSEASGNLKKIRMKVIIFGLLTILSSVFLFMAAGNPDEVLLNYGSLLFWFFAYRLLTYLAIDYLPVKKEYRWYRRLAAMKICFSEDSYQKLDSAELTSLSSEYEHEADRTTRDAALVDYMFMDDSAVTLGCRIDSPASVLKPSGIEGIEVISEEMTDYLLGALPFIKHRSTSGLELEAGDMTDELKIRIADAIRNKLAFLISDKDEENRANNFISITFAAGLFISMIILYIWGRSANLAVHEFILVLFWFFADYLLEFTLLSRTEIKSDKKTLEKLANIDITFVVR